VSRFAHLKDEHLHALRIFDAHPMCDDEIETIDVRAGLEVIREGLVEMSAPVIGTVRLRLTDAGRAALAEQKDGTNGGV